MPFTVGSNSDHVEPGTYPAILQAVEVATITSSFGVKDMYRWQFQVAVADDLKPMDALSSMNMGPQAKAHKWLTALLRRPLVAGEQIADPIGANALVVIGDNAKGYSTITDVLPAPQTAMSELLPGVPR